MDYQELKDHGDQSCDNQVSNVAERVCEIVLLSSGRRNERKEGETEYGTRRRYLC